MKKNLWLLFLMPQAIMFPLVYWGVVVPADTGLMKFGVLPIMAYVLYVCFLSIRNSNSKEDIEKVQRTIYSGLLGYFFMSVFLLIALLKAEPVESYMITIIVSLQALQYGAIIFYFHKMKKMKG